MVERPFTEGRQFDAVSLPNKQLDTKRFFEPGERLAHAGLSDTDRLGSSGKAACFGDGDQAAKLRQIHSSKTYIRFLFQ